MSMDITTVNSRLLNSTQKRQIMWNIIEPGDPYDIRKYFTIYMQIYDCQITWKEKFYGRSPLISLLATGCRNRKAMRIS